MKEDVIHKLPFKVWVSLLRKKIASGYDVKLEILGNSMYPTLKNGDVVSVKSSKPEDIRKGTIIVFHHWPSNLTTHRVVAIHKCDGETIYKTQGDNNPVPDNYGVIYSEIIGAVSL